MQRNAAFLLLSPLSHESVKKPLIDALRYCLFVEEEVGFGFVVWREENLKYDTEKHFATVALVTNEHVNCECRSMTSIISLRAFMKEGDSTFEEPPREQT